MTSNIRLLRDSFKGKTATIVGCGPSILELTHAHFEDGPVIALNHAILTIRALNLWNPVFSMQKDGCTPHGVEAVVPLGCVCPSTEVVEPRFPETLLLSAAESSRCFPLYAKRCIFDNEQDLGVAWFTSSAPTAVKIAELMGCRTLRMFGHDAYTAGDTGRVPGSSPSDQARAGYVLSGQEVQTRADMAGITVEWMAP